MKKVLLATSALVAFTGVAAADINLSGSARFGLKYTDTPAAGFSKTSLEKRVTVNIDASTETDGGLELGARIRLRADEGTTTAAAGANVYLKTGGFKLTVGNICGAIECMPGLYTPSVGLDGNGWSGLVTNTADTGYWGWDAYSSNGVGANGAEVEYTAGDFKAHLSYGSINSVTTASNRVALTLAYTFGDWTAALGLQEGDAALGADDKTVLTVQGKLGDFGVGIGYADNNGTDKVTLNGSYTMGATTISAFVADDSSVAATDNPWGLGVSYDLGGAALVGGISNDEVGTKRATAGIKFSF